MLFNELNAAHVSSLKTAGAFTVGRDINISNSATVNSIVGGNTAHNSAFSGAVTITNANSSLDLTAAAGGVVTFSGLISGTGAAPVEKIGAGTVSLANPTGNTYGGNTTITAGTLLANNTSNSATGTGTVSIGSGATLGGAGFIDGAVTALAGGKIAPGNSPGTLTIDDNVSFTNSSSQFIVELIGFANPYGQLVVNNGGVTLGSATLAASSVGVVPGSSQLFIIVNDGVDGIAGTFNGLPNFGDTVNLGGMFPGGTAQISYTGDSVGNTLTGGNDVVLFNFQNVPEPASLALLALGGVMMAYRRRACP